MVASPIRYTPDLEEIRPDEAETIEQLCRAFDTILETTSKDYGHAVRSVHAKGHAILRGEMVVEEGLPPELAQGLFARPGRHPVILRLSTNAGDILPDTISLPRGLALKVLDVDGERLEGAEDRTQDFIMVNGTVFQAKTADAFLGNLRRIARTTDKLERTKVALSAVLRGVNATLKTVGIDSPAVNALGGAPNIEPLGATYYSVTPFRYGDHVAKFSLLPVAPAMAALTGRTIEVGDRRDAIREDVRREAHAFDLEWAFRVQLCRDVKRQPIEQPTIEWDEADAPFQTVARVHVTAQDSWDPAVVAEVEDGMRFSVWTGLAAHRPLGNINRARRDTYRHSADFRAAFNACPYHEPSALPEHRP